MPVTFKSANVKYKNSQGQYVGVNTVSDNTTADQIAAIQAAGATNQQNVNTAGAAQITAMQNKAAEIEQSWPSDYSELTDAVDDMIAIQPTQPTSEDTKIWINSSNTQTTVQVPTYEELTELSSALYYESLLNNSGEYNVGKDLFEQGQWSYGKKVTTNQALSERPLKLQKHYENNNH